MTVDIICPLYEAEQYIETLHQSLLKQKHVQINEIQYILTRSMDCSEKILQKNQLNYKVIDKEDFSHSLVREEAAMKSKADIICFISQDIIIDSEYWLEKLVSPIINGEVEATYSRQLTKFNNIEKYTREFNYPEQSLVKTKKDIPKLGLKTIFFSDASSAIKTDVFKTLKGYDGKLLPINEDMYFAHKLIANEYRIGYQADSVVYHSHQFSLKELYDRYKLIGIFFRENSDFNQYRINSSGGNLAKYVFKRSIQDKNVRVLIRYPLDMAVRWIGMKAGKYL